MTVPKKVELNLLREIVKNITSRSSIFGKAEINRPFPERVNELKKEIYEIYTV